MKYRNKSLLTENFDDQTYTPDELETVSLDPSETIRSEVSADEATVLVEEGEDLASDSDTVMGVMNTVTDTESDAAEAARTLVVEQFVAKWGIKKLTTESLVATGKSGSTMGEFKDEDEANGGKDKEGSKKNWLIRLWERFLKWLDGFIETVKSSWRSFTSDAKKYGKIHAKLAEKLKALGGNPNKKKDVAISLDSTLARLIYIDNKPEGIEMALDLPRTVKEVIDDLGKWAENNAAMMSGYIKLEPSGDKFTRKGYEGLKHMFGTGYFKGIEKKLKKIGPKDSAEEQYLVPLINNDYLQCFSYVEKVQEDGVVQVTDTIVNGVRYIKGEQPRMSSGDGRNFPMFVAGIQALPVNQLIAFNGELKKLIDSLAVVESHYSDVTKSITKLRDNSKQITNELKSKDLSPGVRRHLESAQRVSREAIFSTQHTYQLSSNLTRNAVALIAGIIKLALTCWEPAK